MKKPPSQLPSRAKPLAVRTPDPVIARTLVKGCVLQTRTVEIELVIEGSSFFASQGKQQLVVTQQGRPLDAKIKSWSAGKIVAGVTAASGEVLPAIRRNGKTYPGVAVAVPTCVAALNTAAPTLVASPREVHLAAPERPALLKRQPRIGIPGQPNTKYLMMTGGAFFVARPAAGEQVCQGVIYQIQWQYAPVSGGAGMSSQIAIHLLDRAAGTSSVLTNSVAMSDRAYSWTVPAFPGTFALQFRAPGDPEGEWIVGPDFSVNICPGVSGGAPPVGAGLASPWQPGSVKVDAAGQLYEMRGGIGTLRENTAEARNLLTLGFFEVDIVCPGGQRLVRAKAEHLPDDGKYFPTRPGSTESSLRLLFNDVKVKSGQAFAADCLNSATAFSTLNLQVLVKVVWECDDGGRILQHEQNLPPFPLTVTCENREQTVQGEKVFAGYKHTCPPGFYLEGTRNQTDILPDHKPKYCEKARR